MNTPRTARLTGITNLILAVTIAMSASPTTYAKSPTRAQRLLSGDGTETPAARHHASKNAPQARPPVGHLPHRDDPDEFFTFRYMVSGDGAENWSEILGAGDPGMYERDENGEPYAVWPGAAYNFGVVATSENDLHFITVLNGFSDEEELNPEGRENGVYDVKIDGEGNSSYTLIHAQENGTEMTWADAGIGVNDTLCVIWVTVSNNTAGIWSAWSGNNGAGWSQPRQIIGNLDIGDGSESNMPYPHMTHHVGHYFFVIYQTANQNGTWDHHILRVPTTLQGNIVAQNPNASSASFVSYYVGAVNPIDQDVAAGWVYFVVRSQDNAASTIGRSSNNGANWQTTQLNGAPRYPSIALDPEARKPWVFSNFGVGNPHKNWYSFDSRGYGGGDWIQPHELDQVEYDGARDLLYIHQGVFTSENRLVSGCNIWGQFTPEGFQTNYSDDPYNHNWAEAQRLYSIFDEESLEGGFIPQNAIVAGGDNHVFVAFAGKYGAADRVGPTIENVTLSDFRRERPWVVSAELTDINGIAYTDVDFWVEGQQDIGYMEPDSGNFDEAGNGVFFYTIPSDEINGQRLAAGDSVFFFIYAQDQLGNENESGVNTIIVDEGWIPAEGGEPEEPVLQHFTEFAETDGFHSIDVTHLTDRNGDVAPNGWEVGAFTQDQLLAGAEVWQEEAELSFPAWQDDQTTDAVDGFQDGEQIAFRLWDNEADEEVDAAVEVEDGSIEWHDGWTAVVSLSVGQGENNPPEWVELPQIVEAREGDLVTFNVEASDPDGDEPHLGLNRGDLPREATFTYNGDGHGVFRWQTGFDDAGEYEAIFVLDDGEFFEMRVVHITILNDYRPPTAFSLVSPEDNFFWQRMADPVTFSWNRAVNLEEGDIRYHLKLWGFSLAGVSDSLYIDVGNDTAFSLLLRDLSEEFEHGFEMDWSVIALNDSDSTASEQVFHIEFPDAVSGDIHRPTSFVLHPSFPNPFNSATRLSFELPENSRVTIRVFDVGGQQVSVVENGDFKMGVNSTVWNANNLPPGVYLIRMDAGGQKAMQKVVLVK